MFLFRSYFLRSHIQTFHRHQRRKIFITIIPSQKHGYKYTRIHSHRISSIERIHPPALFFQRIEANHRYLVRIHTHTTTGMYWPGTKKKKKTISVPGTGRFGINWQADTREKRMLLTRRWETASVNGAIVNRCSKLDYRTAIFGSTE